LRFCSLFLTLDDAEQVSISSTFNARLLRQYFCAKKLQSQNVTREKLHEAILYKKFARKMLMKLPTAFEVSV